MEECQDIIESFEKLIKGGKKFLEDLSHEEFNEAFVFNNRLREILVPVWYTFGCYFADQLSTIEIDTIKFHPVSENEHFTMLLTEIRNSTKEITIIQFLDAFKKTVL